MAHTKQKKKENMLNNAALKVSDFQMLYDTGNWNHCLEISGWCLALKIALTGLSFVFVFLPS